jgi:GH15 family glucan-1,4-alpha-glucosidase
VPGRDGVPGKEGAFLPCTFWLLEALLRLGRRDEGLRLFDQILALTTDLLLLPEEIDPATGDFLGNYPLALSQAGLVHAVLEVQRVLED